MRIPHSWSTLLKPLIIILLTSALCIQTCYARPLPQSSNDLNTLSDTDSSTPFGNTDSGVSSNTPSDSSADIGNDSGLANDSGLVGVGNSTVDSPPVNTAESTTITPTPTITDDDSTGQDFPDFDPNQGNSTEGTFGDRGNSTRGFFGQGFRGNSTRGFFGSGFGRNRTRNGFGRNSTGRPFGRPGFGPGFGFGRPPFGFGFGRPPFGFGFGRNSSNFTNPFGNSTNKPPFTVTKITLTTAIQVLQTADANDEESTTERKAGESRIMITAISMAGIAFLSVILLVVLFVKVRRRYRRKKFCIKVDADPEIAGECEKLITTPPKNGRRWFWQRPITPEFETAEPATNDVEPAPFEEKFQLQRPPPARIPPPPVPDMYALPIQEPPIKTLTREGIFDRYANTGLTMPPLTFMDTNPQQPQLGQQPQASPSLQRQLTTFKLGSRRPSYASNGGSFTPLTPPRQVRRKLVKYGYLSGATDATQMTGVTGTTGVSGRQLSLDSLFSELSGTIPSFLVTEGARSWKSESRSNSEGATTGNRHSQSPGRENGPGSGSRIASPFAPGMAEEDDDSRTLRNRVSQITPEGVLEQMISDDPARRELNGTPPLSRKQTFGDLLGHAI